MKKKFMLAAVALVVTLGTIDIANAGQFYRFGPNGYSNTYTDFTITSPFGSRYSGTIWGR